MEGAGGQFGSGAPTDEVAVGPDESVDDEPVADRPGIVRRALWWLVGPILTAVLLGFSVLMLLAPTRRWPQPEPADLFALALTFVLAGSLLVRRRWPVEATAAAAVAVAAFGLRTYPLTLLLFAPGLCTAAAVYRCSLRRAAWSVLVGTVGLGAFAVVGSYRGDDVAQVLVGSALLVAVGVVARLVPRGLRHRRDALRWEPGTDVPRWFSAPLPPVAGPPDSPASWAVAGGGALVVVVVVTVAFLGVLAPPALTTGDDQVLAVGLGSGGATGVAAGDGTVYAAGVFGGADAAPVVQVQRLDAIDERDWSQVIGADPIKMATGSARPAVAVDAVSGREQIAVSWLDPTEDEDDEADEDGAATDDPPAPGATIAVFDDAGNPRWTDHLGSGASVFLVSAPVGLPDGGFAIAGAVDQPLDGTPLQGPSDAFVRSYRADGTVRWTRQFGTDDRDGGVALAADGAGDLYVVGSGYGSFEPGGTGAFVAKLDGDGTMQWTRQFGEDQLDVAVAVAADAGGAVVVSGEGAGFGSTRNRVIAFGPDGSERWQYHHQVTGSGLDRVVVLDGTVYAAGCERRQLLGVGVGSEQGLVVEVVDGEVVANREIGGAGGACIDAFAPGNDGRLLVGGTTTDERDPRGWFLVEIGPP